MDINQVVAMIPHTVNGQQHYFMFKQLGQDVTNLGGFHDDSDEDDNSDSN